MPDPAAAPEGAAGSARATVPAAATASAPVAVPGAVPTASAGDAGAGQPRQSVVKSAGARRARLTPAPDTDTSPEPPSREEGGQTSGNGSSTSANDARLRQDKPPHW